MNSLIVKDLNNFKMMIKTYISKVFVTMPEKINDNILVGLFPNN